MTQDEMIDYVKRSGLAMLLEIGGMDKCLEAFAQLVAAREREAIYRIVSHAPFTEAFDDGELQSEVGDALKSMAFSICSEIRQRENT